MGEAGFAPGQMFAGRYRIVGLLGRGGMGEVFRAEDLRIGQQVALKFLHRKFSQDTLLVNRFTSEVRLARQISHPNVCRVYDLGESDGHHYLAMEYVDGEDLATLLKRIGRFPPDKAVEIAHQLCAGLAAAHERGVLHRDLKPANVMIDGRGRARIMDFGLARPAEEEEGKGQVAGTPAYMAPEQLSGGAVSIQSDLFSLGLILYEVFTGKRAFKAQTYAERVRTASTPAEPLSKHTPVDAAVERAVLRCLEHDAKARPASALTVSAALPGGDPLAAALAAGETPSPEMVAAAGAEGTIHPGIGLACLAVLLLAMVCASLPAFQRHLIRVAPNQWPPEVLAKKAQEIIALAGHTQPPVDSQWAYSSDAAQLADSLGRHRDTSAEVEEIHKGYPSALLFVYRQSPLSLPGRGPALFPGTREDPPPTFTGIATVVLDSQSRLRSLEVVAPQFDKSEPDVRETDWSKLFEAAGLDQKQFKAGVSRWTPALFCDQRAAWEGVYPERPDVPVRVEAGSYRGKPVWFEVIFPWKRPERMQAQETSATQRRGLFVAAILFLVVPLVLGLVIAQKNLRMGRGDRVGASRVAWFVFATFFASGLFAANHTLELGSEFLLLLDLVAFTLLMGVQTWLSYVALEPYTRRRWPEMLISWNRLLAGKWQDPLVGRDILLGAAFAGILLLWWLLVVFLERLLDMQGLGVLAFGRWSAWGTMREIPTGVLGSLSVGALAGLAYLFALLLIRAVVRKQWLAILGLGLVQTMLFSSASPTTISWILGAGVAAIELYLLVRHGLLALAAFIFFAEAPKSALTLELSAWYAPVGFVQAAILLAIAAFGFYTATRGRRLFGTSLLED